MVKYTISIPTEINDKITKIANEKGITNNNEIRDAIVAYYSQATPAFSYADSINELEEELLEKAKSIEKPWIFQLADLDTIKKIERVSGEFKPSTIKATIGKNFYKKVMKSDTPLYEKIFYEGTRQRIAVYRLEKI